MEGYDTLKKQWGDKLTRGSEIAQTDVISTGSISLDYATGIGGFPVGSIVEIYGRSSVGKTTLAYYTMAGVQDIGEKAGYVNLEGNFDPIWAKRTSGLNLDDLWLARPNLGSEAIEMLIDFIRSGELKLVVFDSIGTMMNDSEFESSDSKVRAGGQAMMVQHMVKLATSAAIENNCCVLFLNQVRDKIGAYISRPGQVVLDSPGGHAKEHNAGMRIYLTKGERFMGKVDKDQVETGFRVAAQIKKNKMAAPNRKAYWNFWNYPNDLGIVGIDRDREILDAAIQNGVIVKKGGWYEHPLLGEKSVQGSDAVFDIFKKNPDAREQLRDELMSHAFNSMQSEIKQERESLVGSR
jgi:recombination protein RecA